jgi:hypothetical protein
MLGLRIIPGPKEIPGGKLALCPNGKGERGQWDTVAIASGSQPSLLDHLYYPLFFRRSFGSSICLGHWPVDRFVKGEPSVGDVERTAYSEEISCRISLRILNSSNRIDH